MEALAKQCTGTFQRCSVTGQPHIPLKGTDQHGKFWTLIAQPYPLELATQFAQLLSKALRG